MSAVSRDSAPSLTQRPGGLVELAAAVLAAAEALDAGVEAARAGRIAADEPECRAAVAILDRVEGLVRVGRGRALGLIRQDGRWALDGDRDFAGWRGRTSGQGRGAARRETTIADGLDALPGTARAVESGEVTLGHADVLASLFADASPAVRDRLTAGGDAELLPTATRTDVPTFRKKVQAWAGRIDADQADRDAESMRRRRYLRVTGGHRGTRIDGFLDPFAGATLRTALEALTPAPAANDDRTPDQRRADALTALAGCVLDSGTEKPGAQVRPHLNLLVPHDTWLLLLRRRRAPACGSSAGTRGRDDATDAFGRAGPTAGDDARPGVGDPVPSESAAPGATGEVPLAQLDDGTLVPFSVLDVTACDCEMTRIVLDADGVPLDVGQTQRTYTKELRRAVLARDRHCRWPGCTMRAAWCEVHHRTWFADGGRTSLENAITLCVFHHHEVHARRLRIAATRDGHSFTRPDGQVVGTSTRLQEDLLVPGPRGARPDESRGARPDGPRARAQPPGAPPLTPPPRGTSPPTGPPRDESPPGERPSGTSPPDDGAHPPDHDRRTGPSPLGAQGSGAPRTADDPLPGL